MPRDDMSPLKKIDITELMNMLTERVLTASPKDNTRIVNISKFETHYTNMYCTIISFNQ
jgi:hypothetical protein